MVPGYRRTRPPRATRVLMLNQVDDNRRCQNHHAMPALRPQLTPPYRHLLAIDTSTDVLSLALAISDGTANVSAWAITTTSGASGAKASAGMVPAIQKLVRDAGLTFTDLDAVVFGQGPGAFTGLRTACAVAQGLAASARRGVYPSCPSTLCWQLHRRRAWNKPMRRRGSGPPVWMRAWGKFMSPDTAFTRV